MLRPRPMFLVVIAMLLAAPALTAPAQPANIERTHWMKTMEETVGAKETTNSVLRVDAAFGDKDIPTDPSFIAWLGWFLAGAFFLVLLNLHLRLKRRQDLLLHGDGPDLFLLPPANNRRRRPR